MALETRFCSSRRSRRRSDCTASERGTKVSSRPFSRAIGANSTSSWRRQLVDPEARDLRLHRAGVEPRDVEQRAEDLLDRVERGVDVADQLGVVAAALPLDQAGDVEPRGVERLQDVVAGRGEEPGLGDVGLVGVALARPARRSAGSAPRCARTARSSVSLARSSAFGRLHARRDVGEGGDDAAVRHRLERTSITRWRSAKRSRNGSCPRGVGIEPSRTSASTAPVGRVAARRP